MSQRLEYFEGLDRDLGEYPDQNVLPSLTHGHFTKGAEMISLPESDMSSVITPTAKDFSRFGEKVVLILSLPTLTTN